MSLKKEGTSLTVMRWICIGLGMLGFVVAYRVSDGNLLASLSFSLAPMMVLVGIERGLEAAREQRTSGLTESRFSVRKAGGSRNLRHQATLIRVCSYLLIAVAAPMLVVGIVVATQGSLTAFFIALAAAFMLYGARAFLNAASKMAAAADAAP